MTENTVVGPKKAAGISRQALHAIEEQSRKDHEAKVKAEQKVRSRRPTSVPSLQYESSPGEEVVGGFFFDIGAVRTDLTEMLRAGRTFGSGARRRQTVVGARAEQAQGVERAARVDRDARVGERDVVAASSETVAREVAAP